MSDKTKFYAEQARLQRLFEQQQARDAAKPVLDPRCACGAPAAWAKHERFGKVTWFCDTHAPV